MARTELRTIQENYLKLGLGPLPQAAKDMGLRQAGYLPPNSERGMRTTPENATRYWQRLMYVDPALRAAILDLRHMDRVDGRVKKIHKKMAVTTVKGGLKLKIAPGETRLIRLWKDFETRLSLHRHEKLESDARGLAMEGNLPMQWVLDNDKRVVAGIRMPSETIRPVVDINGRFTDAGRAYEQFDLLTGNVAAAWPLWQLNLVRLSPDNHDDMGAMGRPYMDASRGVWQKLMMTEEDLVIRRRERAPLRTVHVLEGASDPDLQQYRLETEDAQKDGSTNYYLNTKGGVTALQGDANLDQIADVAHLLDTFFAGSPAPKGLFGYSEGLNRDILEDMKRDFFEEIDALQDTLSFIYLLGFRLDLLLRGINPDNVEMDVQFMERRTDTPNQRADLALKLQALGVGHITAWETAGLEPAAVLAALQEEQDSNDPYPGGGDLPEDSAGGPSVKITPGNQRKGESGTAVSNQ